MKKFRKCSESGFTIIESMLAVIVIGLLAIIAIPRVIPTDKKIVYATQRQILADMRYARGSAIAKSQNYTITFNVDPLTPTQYDSYDIHDGDGNVIKSLDIPEKVVCEPVGGFADDLTFTRLGNTTTPDGQILQFTIGSYVESISVISATGRVY